MLSLIPFAYKPFSIFIPAAPATFCRQHRTAPPLVEVSLSSNPPAAFNGSATRTLPGSCNSNWALSVT